jgi:AAA family ATP:ADP antiporter
MTSESGWSSEDVPEPEPARAQGFLAKLVDVRPGEGASLVLSAVYFFTLLAGYFVLKPVREAMGLTGGADKLPLLFSGTMAGMILVNPAFAWLVTRVPRRVFIPVVYAVSIACLLGFRLAFALVPETHELWVGYPYFVFVSVFNLFVVSVFWGFMADIWRLEQAKRLYGFIGAGGTIGAFAGASAATWLARPLHSVNLLYISVGFLALSIVCIRWLMRLHAIDRPGERVRPEDRVAGEQASAPALLAQPPRAADTWRGIRLVGTNPYLRTIATYTFLFGLIGTFLYFQQGNLVERGIPDRDARTHYFGLVETLSQAMTGIVQVFFTGRLIKRFGITFALNTQPVIALAGWVALALMLLFGSGIQPIGSWPAILWVLIVVQVLLRASNFATARPARESLYTVVGREMKYKSKSFIDTFVYRFADATGGWTFLGLQVIGLGLSAIAVATIPLTGVWILVGRALGRRQRELVAATSAAETVGNQTIASKSAATA